MYTIPSCDQLMLCTYKWLKAFCESKSMKVLYTDVTKAFDSVNHRIILQLLYQAGFNNKIVSWLKSFLDNRQQQVCIGNAISSPLNVLSGVPQGSVIGPFIFNIVFNGISNCGASKDVLFTLFADDSKISCPDITPLQASMDSAASWLHEHQLELAPHKCAILKIKKKSLVDDTEVYIGNHLVEEKSSVKDLGIFVDSNMKWATHYNFIFHKASVKSFQILKTLKTKNIWTYIKIFTTYIRPQVEYNTQIWSPYLLKDVKLLEKIQKNFTKQAFQRCNIPFQNYLDRLNKINMLTLKNRKNF